MQTERSAAGRAGAGGVDTTRSYRRRDGTSGICGQLYESKLLALVLLRLQRLQRHGRVTRFRLATNMAGAGAFDDVCLEMDVAGRERPRALFVQLKHKANDRTLLSLDNKADREKWFDSLLKVNKNIASQDGSSAPFGGDVTEADCLFILYTNEGLAGDSNTEFVSDYATVLKDVLATSDTPGFRPHFTEQHLEELKDTILEAELLSLAKRFVTFLNVEKSMNMMLDECILQYHVVLKQRVVDVTEIQTEILKWRNLTFQKGFFDIDEKHITLFRNHLIKEILGIYPGIRHNSDATQSPPTSVEELIKSFLSDPSAATLTPLIITHIAWKENDKLEFLIQRPPSDIEKLREISTSMSGHAIAEAMDAARAAAEKYLRSLKVQVPITFGNVDLTVSGSPKKIERRLKYLKTALVELCKVYEPKDPYKIVTLDDSMDGGLVSPNGGLGGAVGNILTYDAETEMLQFFNDFESLPSNAKTLFMNLRNEIENLQEYRFDVKTTKLPKLHIAHGCTNVVKEFLSKLVVFAKQQNHSAVEETVKKEIQDRLSANPDPHRFLIKSDSVFLHYHNKIQRMWMSPKTGEYLTETSALYEEAINDLMTEPQISALQTTFFMTNVKYGGYSFVENATKWMELKVLPSTMFIVTDTVTLTTMKVTECLRNHYAINKYAVLDLENVLNLPKADFSSLNAELKKTENLVIIVCNTRHNSTSCIKLYELTQSAKEKKLIVIANNAFIEKINESFSSTNDVFEDKTQSLTALTPTSQSEVTRNAKVTFQGRELGLDLILDEVSVAFIKSGVLDTLIRNETIHVGTTLSNSRYDEFKHLYMDRRLRPVPVGKTYDLTKNDDSDDDSFDDSDDDSFDDSDDVSTKNDTEANEDVLYNASHFVVVHTFHDIKDDAVLITAAPGMGKSTLLTHLALNTRNRSFWCFWIVRVNFIEHSKQFYKWHDDNVLVDPVESLTFLCHVAVRNKDMSISIRISDDEARLVNCTGDDLDAFELSIFLHFYNKNRVIFVFDGFDEICPYYKDKVTDVIDVAKNSLRKSKMWVSTRPYSDILPALERVVGRRFELDPFSEIEQDDYLKHYWSAHIMYEKLKSKGHNYLLDMYMNISAARSLGCEWIHKCFCSFDEFLFNLRLFFFGQNCMGFLREAGYHRHLPVRTRTHRGRSGVPLLLYFVAEYFVNIVNMDGNHIKPYLEINSNKMLEVFIENKIKKILLQDKNDMDLCNPITRGILVKEVARCVSVHKRLAAYAELQRPVFEAMDIEEFKEMNPLHAGADDLNALLSDIKTGVDKIGLVSHVTPDGVPVFIHRSFSEYFTAGYVCDILKSDKFSLNQKTLLYCAIIDNNHSMAVGERRYFKRILDEEQGGIIKEIEAEERQLLYMTPYVNYFDRLSISRSQLLRISCSSTDDYDSEFFDKYVIKKGAIFMTDGVRYRLCSPYSYDILSDLISSMKPHLKKHFREVRPRPSAPFIVLRPKLPNFVVSSKGPTTNDDGPRF